MRKIFLFCMMLLGVITYAQEKEITKEIIIKDFRKNSKQEEQLSKNIEEILNIDFYCELKERDDSNIILNGKGTISNKFEPLRLLSLLKKSEKYSKIIIAEVTKEGLRKTIFYFQNERLEIQSTRIVFPNEYDIVLEKMFYKK